MNSISPPSDFAVDPKHLEDSRFAVPGMRCAGCVSKLESGMGSVPGVAAARVNFSAKQLAISHEPSVDDRALVLAIAKLGFEAQPLSANPLGDDHAERRHLIRALGVAGFGMMNIMLLSVSIWSGATGITRELFYWLSALIAVPTVAYAGRPFFNSAIMALRYRRTNMDVPISIGVLLATGMSLYETIAGGREAYFEGAVMLLFFLLAGSSFVYIGLLGTSKLSYGLIMLSQSFAYIVGTFWCRRLLARHGLRGAVRRGALFTLAGCLSMAALSLAGVQAVWAVMLPSWLYCVGHGVHQPCGQAGAIGPFPDKAGTAASLSGFWMMLVAFGVGLFLGSAASGTALPMTLGMSTLGLLLCATAWTLVQRHGDPVAEHLAAQARAA